MAINDLVSQMQEMIIALQRGCSRMEDTQEGIITCVERSIEAQTIRSRI